MSLSKSEPWFLAKAIRDKTKNLELILAGRGIDQIRTRIKDLDSLSFIIIYFTP